MKISHLIFLILFCTCIYKILPPQTTEPSLEEIPPNISTNLLPAPHGYTPYDAYLLPVRRVLVQLPIKSPTYDFVAKEQSRIRLMPYEEIDPYTPVPPLITERRKAGDCKSKSLLLLSKMGGDVSFVVGKLPRSRTVNHAWLEWKDADQTWILDPTLNYYPVPKEVATTYTPLYYYTKQGSFSAQ